MGRWRNWSDALVLEAKFCGFDSRSAYNNKILKILYFQYWDICIMVSTADSDSAGFGSNPDVPTNTARSL